VNQVKERRGGGRQECHASDYDHQRHQNQTGVASEDLRASHLLPPFEREQDLVCDRCLRVDNHKPLGIEVSNRPESVC
jgi:hypothetical protein